MTVETSDPGWDVSPDAAPIFGRAAAADVSTRALMDVAIADLFVGDEGRLDDRTRAVMTEWIGGIVTTVAHEIAAHAGQLLTAQGLSGPAALIEQTAASVFGRLVDSGLLRNDDLMAELFGQVREAGLGGALAANRQPGSAPMLLPRLVSFGDDPVARYATAYLVADSRRRAPASGRRGELPADLHHRIVWWSAAALRDRRAGGGGQTAIDRALAEAAQQSLSAHDEDERLAVIAMRLAAAIDARQPELPDLLIEALEEGRVALFTALIGYAQHLNFVAARGIVLDPAGDRLWLVLRTQGLDRASIARIALSLADADPNRDIEAFADELDAIAAISPEAARAGLAQIALDRDFRFAVRALARPKK